MVVADMSEPSNDNKSRPGQDRSNATADWERRAADLANEVQRWLIRQSARNMRDEFSGQIKKTLRGPAPSQAGDVWEQATTEPPDAASQPPECAWCPICRAARRMAQTQVSGGQAGGSPRPGPGGASGAGVSSTLAGATDAIVGAARDALTGLDAILSYRPGDLSTPKPDSNTGQDAGSAWAQAADSDSGSASDSVPASASADGVTQPDASSQPGEHEHEPDHRG
jgi:hypothetical protein